MQFNICLLLMRHLQIQKHRRGKIMMSHETRNMVLHKPIRKMLSMSACIEAQKPDVETDDDASEFNLTYRD